MLYFTLNPNPILWLACVLLVFLYFLIYSQVLRCILLSVGVYNLLDGYKM